MTETVLEVKHLSLSFQTFSVRVQAVRDVSFSLHQGDTLALVGESGCGKSATCRAIMRLLPRNATIDQGEILLHGENLLDKSQKRHAPHPRGEDRDDLSGPDDLPRSDDEDRQADR